MSAWRTTTFSLRKQAGFEMIIIYLGLLNRKMSECQE